MDDIDWDEKSLGKWQYLQRCRSLMPNFFQTKTNNVTFTFSVGDTTQAFYNWYWERQIELGDTNNNVKFSFEVVHHWSKFKVLECRRFFPSYSKYLQPLEM
jgi:hypothetical protein